MSIRKKTVRRLLILLGGVVLLVGAAAGAYLYRQHQHDQRALEEKARGESYFEDAEYKSALFSLSRYLRRFPDDIDALYLAAQARLAIVETDGKHLALAMPMLERVKSQRPDLLDAQVELLDVYLSLGRGLEALELADDLLARKKNDPDLLWGRTSALNLLGRVDEVMPAVEAFLAARPLDLKAHTLVLSLKSGMEVANEDLVGYARELAENNPDSTTCRLLLGYALAFWGERVTAEDGEPSEAETILIALCDAGDLGEGGAEMLIGSLRRIGQRDRARSLMEAVAEGDPSSPLNLTLVQGDWNAGRYEEVTARIEKLEQAGRHMDLALVALKIISLARLSDLERARSEFENFERTFDQPGATAWRRFLSGVVLNPTDPVVQRIDACLEVIRTTPDVAIFHSELGRLYETVKEFALATKAYADAYKAMPLWPEPLIRAARLFALAGNIEGAATLARTAEFLSPEHPETRRVSAMVASLVLPSIEEAEVLEGLSDHLSGQTSDADLNVPLLVATLATREERGKLADGKDSARALIRETLDEPGKLDEQLILRLLRLSDRFDLGASKWCIDKYIEGYGVTASLGLAVALAETLPTGLGIQKALDTFRDFRRRAGNGSEIDWELGEAALLERAGSDEAARAWRLVANHPDAGIRECAAVLNSQKAWDDLELIDDSIDRLRTQTGESGLNWRIGRARRLIRGEALGEEEAREVVDLLSYVLGQAPHMMRLRALLGVAYQRLGDTAGAIEQLSGATKVAGIENRVELELAKLSYSTGDLDQTVDRLRNVQNSDNATARELLEACEMLLSLNELELASAILARDVDWGEDSRRRLVVAARLASVKRDYARTEEMLGELLREPDVETIQLAAAVYLVLGDVEKADETIRMIDGLDFDEATKENSLAEYFSVSGRLEEAVTHYQMSLKEDPFKKGRWLRLVGALIRLGDAKRAIAALEEAVSAMPEDEGLKALTADAALIQKGTDNPKTRGVTSEWIMRPGLREPAVAAIENILKASANPEKLATVAEEVGRIAESWPSFFLLQVASINLFIEAGDWESVLESAHRTKVSFPTKKSPAAAAAQALFRLQRWPECVQAGREWLSRADVDAANARLLIAGALLQQGRGVQAVDELEELIDAAVDAPEEHVVLLGTYGRALVMAKDWRRAEERLLGRIRDDRLLRQLWIEMAGLATSDFRIASRWLKEARSRIVDTDTDDLLILARSWARHAGLAMERNDRTTREACFAEMTEVVSLVERGKDLNARQWFELGMWREWLGEAHIAERNYLKSLKVDPDYALSQNNLAMILARRGDHDKARAHAQALVEKQAEVTEFRDTLAQVLFLSGDQKGALAQLEECRRQEPDSPRWPIAILEMYAEGEIDREAVDELNRVLELHPSRPFPKDLRTRWDAAKKKLETKPK